MTKEVLRERILDTCLISGDFTFAGGAEADNKLDLERALLIPDLVSSIIDRLCELAEPYNPDALTGLPNGATRWAEYMAERMRLPVIYLKKEITEPGNKTYSLCSKADYQYTERRPGARLLVVEDVGSKLTSFRGALKSVPFIGSNALGLVGIWRRLPEQSDSPDPQSTSWMVEEHIPLKLSKDSPYRSYLMPE